RTGWCALGTMTSQSASHRQDPARRTFGGERGTLLAAAMRSPRDVGTLLPSGPELARQLAVVVPGAVLGGGAPGGVGPRAVGGRGRGGGAEGCASRSPRARW